MLSEVDELIGQLEYCFLAKKEKAAKEIVRNLARFKAKLKFTVNILYECSSHYSFKEEHFRTADKNAIQEFVDCKHFVCEECLKYYIKSTYEISKADFPFYCPGGITVLGEPKRKAYIVRYQSYLFSGEHR